MLGGKGEQEEFRNNRKTKPEPSPWDEIGWKRDDEFRRRRRALKEEFQSSGVVLFLFLHFSGGGSSSMEHRA